MKERSVPEFHGKPLTKGFTDDSGRQAYRVTPEFLTPLRVKVAEFCAGVSAVGLAGGGFYLLSEAPHPAAWLWGVALLGPLAAYPALNRMWRLLLHKRVQLVLTVDRFKVLRWNGWRSYDRTMPHKFALVAHDKAQAEKDVHELMVRKGHLITNRRYYTASYHLSFDRLRERNDVLTVYGHKEALAIVNRLQDCDEILDGKVPMGEGIARRPEDEWKSQPGDIR